MDNRQSFVRPIFLILILVSGGLIFGRIMAVDSIPDRTIQEYRLARIPELLKEKAKELRKRGVSEEKTKAELIRVKKRLLADAQKARPTHSANDRSRWLTLRALVEPESRVYRYVPLEENGTKKSLYLPEEILRNSPTGSPDSFDSAKKEGVNYRKEWVPYAIDKGMETPGWETIDMVKHSLPDEEFHPENPYSGYLYSSKPTLLPTLMAIPYGILYHVTGLSLRENPFITVRILLVIYNLIPLLIAWFLLGGMIDRFGGKEDGPDNDEGGNDFARRRAILWTKLFVMAVVCFATFLSTFAVTLNNHLPGVVAIVIALDAILRILLDNSEKKRWFFLAALFGSLAVACELPALLVSFPLFLLLLWKRPKKTIIVALPTAAIVVALFLGTNVLAHGTFRQAYSHKRDHMALATENRTGEEGKMGKARVTTFDPSDWYVYRYFPSGVERVEKNARLSYWSNRQGIDRGEPSRLVYAVNALIGHHGLFSLTPVWILSLIGLIAGLFPRKEVRTTPESSDQFPLRRLASGIGIALTLFFFAFYLTRDQGDRNYGGMTCGLRWFFPLIPFWILAMIPVVRRMAESRIGRGVALILLFLSAMSVSYPLWNPWSHPWLFHLMSWLGWIGPF